MNPIRVLYVSGGSLDFGGIAAVMLSYASHMDPNAVKIDFLVHGQVKGARECEAEALGCSVIHVPYKTDGYFANRNAMLNAMRDGHYDIVHAHMDGMNGYALSLAKKAGVRIRISHSHNTAFLTTNPVRIALHRLMAKRILRVATQLFACTEAAGRFLYGDRAVDDGRVTIVKNAIELDRFTFDPAARCVARERLRVTDRYVIGHIGRFDRQKNQAFLLPILQDVRRTRKNTVLVLVGDGHDRPALEREIAERGLTNSVILTGYSDDVPALLSAFDLFVLPSRFEGLGIVLIEAQRSGLSCLASDRVPQDTRVTNCCFLSLEDAGAWTRAILATGRITENERQNTPQAPFSEAGYDIAAESRRLAALYQELPHA